MAEKLNGPGFGFRMAAAGEQVHVGDVARQAIERLAAREEQLRELLEQWDDLAQDSGPSGMAFERCASQLRAILDGEQ